MKVIFEFDTESKGFYQSDLEAVQNASKLANIIYKITSKTREWYKYDERPAIPATEIRDTIIDIINSQVNMDDLIC